MATYPSETLTYVDAPRRHRGWMVMPYAVEQFCARVAPQVPLADAAAWLAEHAHEAINTGQRTPQGDRLYRLAHPWEGPDAVFVVKVDPDGTRAAVTCGWWDDAPVVDDAPAVPPPRGLQPRPDPAPLPPSPPLPPRGMPTMMATPPRPLSQEEIRKGLQARRPDPPPAPPPRTGLDLCPLPEGLPCPPGEMQVPCLFPGATLDPAALTLPELERWQVYLGALGQAASKAKKSEAIRQSAVNVRRELKQIAHARRMAPVDRRVYDLRDRLGREGYSVTLLRVLGEVTRERLGEEASEAIFNEAKARMVAAAGVDG